MGRRGEGNQIEQNDVFVQLRGERAREEEGLGEGFFYYSAHINYIFIPFER